MELKDAKQRYQTETAHAALRHVSSLVTGTKFVTVFVAQRRGTVPPMRERELVTVFVALDEEKYQVPDVEGPTLHPTVVVPAQRLLVLGRSE